MTSARILGIAAISLVVAGDIAAAQPTVTKPWRLQEAVEAPEWLTFGLAHRSRFEPLQNDFRTMDSTDRLALSMRTLVAVEATGEMVFAGLELQDSRAYASSETTINTSVVDPLDVLQAYVGFRAGAGDRGELRLGRITIDLGSRRFLSRNRFRNTINAFTGLDATWTSAGEHVGRVMAVVPVTRQPRDAVELDGNELALDEENTDTLLWAAYYGSPEVVAGARIEGFVFGLHERDGDLGSRDRQLVTPGFRIWREPAPGALDFQLELALQAGSSRASTAADDTIDLEHRAAFVHAEAGTTFDVPWAPRLIGQLDYASGDGDPDDETNGRFDTLFGGRRFDFGPTSIYGPFARANLVSPGLRAVAEPIARTLKGFVAYRLYWLASDTDAWTSAGLRDPTGKSGSFIGQQIETRIRWHPLPGNVDVELGAALLLRGGFAQTAGGTDAPSTYFYTAVTGTI